MEDAPRSLTCPGCGAPLRDDGVSASITCGYCNTRFFVSGERAKREHDRLAAQIAAAKKEWDLRITHAQVAALVDWARALFLGGVGAVAVVLIVLVILAISGIFSEDTFGIVMGTTFWISFILLTRHVYMGDARKRKAAAVALTIERDEALRPLREKLAELDAAS
jgi:DNA-directed RNA polymerase subunit RPC12/RpoP